MIIGLSGQAGVGKDTIADFLQENDFAKIALADEIKRVAARLFNFTDQQLWGPSHARNKVDPRYNFSPRKALQVLGTEVGRQLDPNLWVNKVLTEALDFDDVVIPDVRFKNEIEAIRKAGGKLVRIKGREASTLSGDVGQHVSETEQQSIPDSAFDFILWNNEVLDFSKEEDSQKLWNKTMEMVSILKGQ